MNQGRVRLAGRLLERAHERAEDPDLVARIEVSRAYVALELGDPDAATRLCLDALARPGLPDPDRGVALSQLAMLQMRRGETAEALESFTAGISLLDSMPRELARALGNRGDLHLHLGAVPAAIADFREAAEHFRTIGADIDRAKADHNRGYALLLDGDVVGALRAMEEAHPVIAPVSPVFRAICEQDRAEALLAAGLVEEGASMLMAAARSYGARRLRQRQGEAQLALARSLLVQDPVRARAAARQAARQFRSLKSWTWHSRAAALALAADVELGGTAPALVDRGTTLAAELAAQGLRWASVRVRLYAGLVCIRRGELERARRVLAERRVPAEAPLEVRLVSRVAHAEWAARRGRRTDALRHVRLGLADLHAWQSSFGSLDLQTMVAGHGTRLGVMGLGLAVDSPRCEVLFEWSERARMLASRIQPVRAPQDEQTAADLAELRTGVAPEREAELRRRIRERAWQHQGSGEVADPVTLAELQAGLDADTALAAYVVTADKVVALVVTDGAAVRHDLGDRRGLDDLLGGLLPDLDVAASDLPDRLARSVRQGLADRLARIGALLMAPLLDELGDRRLVVTPSGVLAGVPWPLLPGLTTRPVTVARSATSWLARPTTTSTATAGFVAGPRVARADAEVAAAASRWKDAPVLTGDAATASAVTELAGRVDVLHVAAHGRHSAENPLFSGLQLADGSWFGYDIDQLPSVPQVVLLSACEVGRSSVRHGEELIGMTSAWLHAGARWVIASAAAANDEVAHDTLVAVHAGLRAGLDPAAALAAVEHREGAAPAPFVCFS